MATINTTRTIVMIFQVPLGHSTFCFPFVFAFSSLASSFLRLASSLCSSFCFLASSFSLSLRSFSSCFSLASRSFSSSFSFLAFSLTSAAFFFFSSGVSSFSWSAGASSAGAAWISCGFQHHQTVIKPSCCGAFPCPPKIHVNPRQATQE